MKTMFLMAAILSFCNFAVCLSAEAVDLGKIFVVTEKRTFEGLSQSGSHVSVITRDEIESSGVQNVPDLLKAQAGLQIFDNGTTKTSTVDIRGFGETAKQNILILVDGRRTNTIDISGTDLIQIPLDLIERVEIVRGGASVLYGDNAVGGVINIITRQGQERLSLETGTYGGSHGTYGQDVLVAGRNADTRYQAYYKYYDEGNFRNHADGMSRDGNVKLGHDVTDKVSLDVTAGFHNDIQHLPGSLTLSDLSTMGREATKFPNDFVKTEEQYVDAVNRWDISDEKGREQSLDLSFNHRQREAYSSYFSGFNTDSDIVTSGVLLKYTAVTSINERPLTTVAGVDFYDHVNDIVGDGFNVDDLTIEKTEMGVYATSGYAVTERLSVNAGTRYHQAEYDFEQRNVIVNASSRPDEWVSQAGIEYVYAKDSQVHASIGQTFRFLSTDEWYSSAFFPPFLTPGLNLNLKQQSGVEYQWGVRHAFEHGFGVSVTNYWHEIRDEIYYDPLTFSNGNYDRTRRIGVEISPTWDVLAVYDWDNFDRLDMVVNLTLQQAEFEGGVYDGRNIPFVPEEQVSIGIESEFLGHYGAGLTGRYMGTRYAISDPANTGSKVKDLFVLDAKVSYEMSVKDVDWEIFGRVDNLLDRTYNSYEVQGFASRAVYPAPGREFLIGVKAKF